jgi:hypothetical protein
MQNDTEHPKPPLGVQPVRLWKESRMQELSRAIYDYISGGFIGGDYSRCIVKWTQELLALSLEIEDEEMRKFAIEQKVRPGSEQLQKHLDNLRGKL